jgi:hypothetical protein
MHSSTVVQASPSSHGVPLGRAAFWHPVVELQLSTVHWFPSSQSGGGPPVQVPVWQVSVVVHASPSLQAVPSARLMF